MSGTPAGKEPFWGPRRAPPYTQHFEQARGEHGVAGLASLALLHAEQHALRVDVDDLQRHRLGNTQAGAVTGHQSGAVLQAGNVVEELYDLLVAEHDGQPVRPPDAWELLAALTRGEDARLCLSEDKVGITLCLRVSISSVSRYRNFTAVTKVLMLSGEAFFSFSRYSSYSRTASRSSSSGLRSK